MNSLLSGFQPNRPPRIVFFEGANENLVSFLENPFPETRKVFVLESSAERYQNFISEGKHGDLLKSSLVQCYIGLDPEQAKIKFYDFLTNPQAASMMDSFVFIPNLSSSDSDRAYFQKMQEAWGVARGQIFLHWGYQEASLSDLENTIANLSFIEQTPGVILLKNSFSLVPAVVAATGPSLEKSLPDLKKHEGKYLLISCDASLKILLDAGIQVHFVVSLERLTDLQPFYKNLKTQNSKTQPHMVVFSRVNPQVVETYNGPKWVSYRSYGYFEYFEKQCPRGMLESAGSVAHMGVRFAEYLDCPVTVLVGQDLAYDPKTLASHSKGIAYENWSQESSEENLRKQIQKDELGELLWKEGNCEKLVPTNSVYCAFAEDYSREATHLKTKLINCTQGGLKIHGVSWKNFAEVAQKWHETEDLFAVLGKKRQDWTPSSINLEPLSQFFKDLELKLKKLHTFVEECLQDRQASAQKKQILEALKVAQAGLKSDPRVLYFVIENLGRFYIDWENRWNILWDKDDETSNRFKLLKEWFEQVLQTTQKVKSILARNRN